MKELNTLTAEQITAYLDVKRASQKRAAAFAQAVMHLSISPEYAGITQNEIRSAFLEVVEIYSSLSKMTATEISFLVEENKAMRAQAQ